MWNQAHEQLQVQQQQDELARLFACNMSLAPRRLPADKAASPPALFQDVVKHDPKPSQVIYTSMHYTPTRHVVPIRFHVTPETSPDRPQPLSDHHLVHLLRQNSIDPHALFPSQIHLLRHADAEQRLRLLELWRISPPNQRADDPVKQMQQCAPLHVQLDENMAQSWTDAHMTDRQQHSDSPDSPAPALTAASWTSTLSMADWAVSSPEIKALAEPYMASGYEILAHKEYQDSLNRRHPETIKRHDPATDPVYLNRFAGVGRDGSGNLKPATDHDDDDMQL